MPASDTNLCIFTGNIIADAEVRYTGKGVAVAHFRVASTWRGYDHAEDKPKERTAYVRCVIWDKLAETVGASLIKGVPVYVMGHLATNKYQDKDGKDQWGWDVVVEKVKFLYKKLADIPAGDGDSAEDRTDGDYEHVPF